MFSRLLFIIFISILSVDSNAQGPITAVSKQAAVIPAVHRVPVKVTPPINNIAAPKEVNKKKRKSSKVTVAQKNKPSTSPASK